MKRLAIPAGLALLILLGLWGALHAFRGTDDARPLDAAFSPEGVLRVTNLARTGTVHVYDPSGTLVATGRTHGRDTCEIPFQWQRGLAYRVVAGAREGEAHAPASTPVLVVRLHTPLGQPPHEYLYHAPLPKAGEHRIPIPAGPNERLDIMLEVERLSDEGPELLMDVSGGPLGEPGGFGFTPRWTAEDEPLAFEFDKLVYSARLSTGDSLPADEALVRVSCQDFQQDFRLTFVPARIAEDDIHIEGWVLPVDALGNAKTGQPRDQVVMPNPVWSRAASWLGVRPRGHDTAAPFTYQAVDLGNRSASPLTVLVDLEGVDPVTGGQSRYFDPPTWESGGGTNRTLAYVALPPGEVTRCVLPVHVDPDTPAGEYLRRLTITPLGSDRVAARAEAPFAVVRTKLLLSAWVAGVALLVVAWLTGVLVLWQRLMRSLGVRTLVLLSLLGSLQFCLSFAGGWVSTVFYAILGPFNCLVGGFLTEVLTYLLVTAILYLVPRVGAMTIAGMVSYLMGGIMFGTFGLTDLLFVGAGLAFREVFLLAFGVTRFHPTSEPPRLLPMMLALGLADAATTFTNLALFAVLYRLFYAHWFIVMNVGVTGFLYTCVGVYLGRSLGRSLREVRP